MALLICLRRVVGGEVSSEDCAAFEVNVLAVDASIHDIYFNIGATVDWVGVQAVNFGLLRRACSNTHQAPSGLSLCVAISTSAACSHNCVLLNVVHLVRLIISFGCVLADELHSKTVLGAHYNVVAPE